MIFCGLHSGAKLLHKQGHPGKELRVCDERLAPAASRWHGI
jgi:hypothetical protein